MTAAVATDRQESRSGLRRFDPGRDLGALADLIELGFAENLDRSGHRMVQGLRALGRLGWLGGLLSRWLLPPAANPRGYVWEEDGAVVGNASLLPVTGFPHRWVMANVVVIPGERRKGIGKSLVTTSIEYARSRGAGEIVLQVDQSNEVATSLYQSLGFTASDPRRTWVGRCSDLRLQSSRAPALRRRKPEEWRQQWQLARTLHPEGLLWPYPTSAAYFKPHSWRDGIGLKPDRHWVWVEENRLFGSASLRWGYEPGTLRLILLVDQGHRGLLEGHLISSALGLLLPLGDVVHMDYPADVAESVLKQMGFVEQRTLIWMKLELRDKPV